jgi:predicted nucleic acid-binding protein
MKVYFDTNVLVAAFQPDHIHHGPSFAAYRRVQVGAIAGYLSCHGLTELYSVLTRAPWKIPVSPKEILAVIEQSVLPMFEIVEVNRQSYLAALRVCGNAGWKGGRVHDAVHIQAAAQAGCDAIYTFDVAHFESLAAGWRGRIQSPPAA